MKKYTFLILIIIPLLTHAQEFNANMTKVETIKYINKIIEPEGNTGSVRSARTQLSYTENYYDRSSRKEYELNLAHVSISKSSSTVSLKCSNDNCIEYIYTTPEGKESSQINELSFKTEKPSDLYKAFLHLKKVCGL